MTFDLSLSESAGSRLLRQKLRERGATLTVAESCTGGMLAERITSVPGSSDYFVGGFLTYTYGAKQKMVGVPAEMLEQYKAVSEPVAKAMAEGAARETGATYAVSVTGVAGPGQGGEVEPVGVVILAVSGPQGTVVRRIQFLGDRHRIRSLAVTTALDFLRRQWT